MAGRLKQTITSVGAYAKNILRLCTFLAGLRVKQLTLLIIGKLQLIISWAEAYPFHVANQFPFTLNANEIIDLEAAKSAICSYKE